MQVCLYIYMFADVIESSISSVIGGTSNFECEGCFRCGGIHQSTYVCAAYLQTKPVEVIMELQWILCNANISGSTKSVLIAEVSKFSMVTQCVIYKCMGVWDHNLMSSLFKCSYLKVS